MKFFEIATALFLAGNAVVAAHEVPSENLITQLADAYNTEVGTYLPRPECMKLGTKLTECVNKIKAKADEDKEIKKWVQAYDKARQTAGRCFNKAMEQGDPSKIEKCGPPLLDITDKYCSTEAYRNECGTGPPLLFEHFVLDTAEELVVAASWGGEEDMDSFDITRKTSTYGLRGSSFKEDEEADEEVVGRK